MGDDIMSNDVHMANINSIARCGSRLATAASSGTGVVNSGSNVAGTSTADPVILFLSTLMQHYLEGF